MLSIKPGPDGYGPVYNIYVEHDNKTKQSSYA